jgi:hypothetical protein
LNSWILDLGVDARHERSSRGKRLDTVGAGNWLRAGRIETRVAGDLARMRVQLKSLVGRFSISWADAISCSKPTGLKVCFTVLTISKVMARD